MQLTKKVFVEEWWEQRLKEGRQLSKDHTTGTRPMAAVWKHKISNELLWDDFAGWLKKEHSVVLPFFNKQSFCTMVYRVTGARSVFMRQGANTRFYAVQFKSLKESRHEFNTKKSIVGDTSLVE